MKSLRYVAAALAVGALAWVGYADIHGLSETEGTLGDSVVVNGTDFGTKKPKLKFAPTAGNPAKGGPKLKAKVTDFSDTSVTFEIKKATVGTFDLTLQPKGGEAQTRIAAFSVVPPAPASVNKESVTRKGLFTITGDNFGSKKGKVLLGGTKGKVKAWSNTSIDVEVNKKQADGVYDITVQGKAGEGTLANGIEVAGDPPKPLKGGNSMSGKLGNDGFKANPKGLNPILRPLPGNIQEGITYLGINIRVGSKTIGQIVTINFAFDGKLADQALPIVETTESDATMMITYTYQVSSRKDPIGENTTWINGPGFKATIDQVSGDQFSGTISGTMTKQSGSGPNSIQVNVNFQGTFTRAQ